MLQINVFFLSSFTTTSLLQAKTVWPKQLQQWTIEKVAHKKLTKLEIPYGNKLHPATVKCKYVAIYVRLQVVEANYHSFVFLCLN